MGKDSMMHRVLHAIILVLIITSAIDVNSDEIKNLLSKLKRFALMDMCGYRLLPIRVMWI